jgi:hypothetical protein
MPHFHHLITIGVISNKAARRVADKRKPAPELDDDGFPPAAPAKGRVGRLTSAISKRAVANMGKKLGKRFDRAVASEYERMK